MKPFIGLLLAISLVFTAIGCSSSESEPDASTSDEATTPAEGSETSSSDANGDNK